jgi:hypothetical protein
VKLLLAVALGVLPLAAGPPAIVARAGDDTVARLVLPESRTFALEYRHSYYREPARETFLAAGDGSFSLVAVSSPSEAVLDYYEIEGERSRHAGWWTLRPARPARFDEMALAATMVGRRTLVAGQGREPLYGGPVHVRLAVEGG